jgi:flavin reductase (DIM6/NTAB) family NADH-FMN oxidoreductase RutF
MRVPVQLSRAYRLITHGPVTLVASAAGERRNVMAASWVMAVDFEPPVVAVVIDSDTATRRLVEASRCLTLNLPPVGLLDLVSAVGHVSGNKVDKLARFQIRTAPASRVHAPLIEGCVGWLECELQPEQPTALTHDLFLATVVAAWVDDAVFVDDRWDFDSHPELRTVHHLGGGVFAATGERVIPAPADVKEIASIR